MSALPVVLTLAKCMAYLSHRLPSLVTESVNQAKVLPKSITAVSSRHRPLTSMERLVVFMLQPPWNIFIMIQFLKEKQSIPGLSPKFYNSLMKNLCKISRFPLFLRK